MEEPLSFADAPAQCSRDTYADDFVRQDGVWRFARQHFDLVYLGVPVTPLWPMAARLSTTGRNGAPLPMTLSRAFRPNVVSIAAMVAAEATLGSVAGGRLTMTVHGAVGERSGLSLLIAVSDGTLFSRGVVALTLDVQDRIAADLHSIIGTGQRRRQGRSSPGR